MQLDGLDAKPHIPDHKLMFVPCAEENEAHYICGVLNSGMIRDFAEAVSLSTSRGTRIFEELNIPTFDPGNAAHLLVAELSKAAHQGTREINDSFEVELDLAVAEALGQEVRIPASAHISEDSLTASLREAVVVGPAVDFPGAHSELRTVSFVAVDVETTGFSPERFADRVLEIGAVRFSLGGVIESWTGLVWPGRPITPGARRVHGINLEALEDKPTFAEVWPELRAFIGSAILVAHNADFDARFLSAHLNDVGAADEFLCVDTLQLLRAQFSLPSNRLSEAVAALGVEGEVIHAALGDATATAQLMLRICELLSRRTRLTTLRDLVSLGGAPPVIVRAGGTGDQSLLRLARKRVQVVVGYRRSDDTVIRVGGTLECFTFGSEVAYLTVRMANGRRYLMRRDRVVSLEPSA